MVGHSAGMGWEGVSAGSYVPLFCLFPPSCYLSDAVKLAGLEMSPGTAVSAGRKSALSSPTEVVRMRENQSCVVPG